MPQPPQMSDSDVLRVELSVLQTKHRELDQLIAELADTGPSDPLQIQRMKKEKLALKDKITQLQDKLTPDIIA